MTSVYLLKYCDYYSFFNRNIMKESLTTFFSHCNMNIIGILCSLILVHVQIFIFFISYKKKKLGGSFSKLSLVWITVIDTWSYIGTNKIIT